MDVGTVAIISVMMILRHSWALHHGKSLAAAATSEVW
jgi:hypothetical protein